MNTIPYYEENYEKIFNAVTKPNWRIWKTIDEDGVTRQNRHIISSPDKLLSFIKEASNPQKLYVSISTFLNPHKNKGFLANQKKEVGDHYLFPKPGYLVADSILLDSYFFIDLDHEDLSVAYEDAVKILKSFKHELVSFQFSGTKGYHLIYKMPKSNTSDPILRIKIYQHKKSLLVNELLKLGLNCVDKHHENIMKDVWRVYAAPYSIKPNGNIVTPINQASEAKADDEKVATKLKTSSTHLYVDKERAGLSSYPLYFKFMDNMVRGLKNNYVTVIKWKVSRYHPNLLKKLQETYKLSDFYVELIGKNVYAYNMKCQQYTRLVKILRAAKSENLHYFVSRRHLPIQLTDSLDQNKKVAERIKFVDIIKSSYGHQHVHSKPHSLMFDMRYPNMSGKANNLGIMRCS